MKNGPNQQKIEKVRSGAGTPNLKTNQNQTKPINNLALTNQDVNNTVQERVREYVPIGIRNGYNIMLFYVNNGELTKIPNWFDMAGKENEVDEEGRKKKRYIITDAYDLLVELQKRPYGYGVLTGKQPGGFSLIAIDVDIDTEECKERLSKKIEELLDKHKIYYHKEITKSGRLHYYIALDEITDKIKSVPKLPYLGNCFKHKEDKKMQGEIELSIDKPLVVYDGFINDKEPFFTMPAVVSSHQVFENFLEDWKKAFEPKEHVGDIAKEPEKEPKEIVKEAVKEPKKETKPKNNLPISKIAEACRIMYKKGIIDGWKAESVFSAVCILNDIPEEQIKEGIKTIFGGKYDEKRTNYILGLTRRKDKNLLPGIGSVRHYLKITLDSGNGLEAYERELLETLLNDLKQNGYSDYELPEYLVDAENIILDYSAKQTNKDGEVYYKEDYFIEQNLNGIKKVVYVKIITSEKGGIYKPHILDGKVKEIGIKTDILRLVKEGKITAYELLINDKEVYKPSFNFSKIDDVIHEITLIALPYTMLFDNSLYKRYLDRKIKEFIKENGEPIPCLIGKQTGWSDDLKFFFHYGLDDKYHELSKDHILYKKNKAVIKNTEEQHRFVKALLREGKLLGVLLVASVSSLFIKPFGIPGITVILAGNSGAGKTTSCLTSTSLFYYSDDVLLNAQTTKTGLELTISSLNSLPILVDEGALAGFNLSLSDLVFMVSSGTGKARGRKDLSVDFKELKSNVFWTTETTDIDEMKRTGAFRRMLYLVVKSWNDLTEILEAGHRLNEEYAGCGVDYIKYAIEYMEEVKKTFKEETEDFSSKYREITPIALNLHAGLILLEKFYNTRFDSLRETINKVLDNAKALFIENKENVVEKLKEFLNRYLYIHFHIIQNDGKIEKAKQEAWGEYDLEKRVYYIRNDSWNEIVRRLEKERKLLTKELKDAGLLTYKDYRHKATNEKIKTYIIKFDNDKEEEVEI